MRKLSIELPDTITVTSRGVSVELDTKVLSAEIIARLAVHGATQKVADAASGAAKMEGDVADNTVALMGNAVAALVAGEWSQRTGGAGVDEETRVARSVVRSAVKAKFGSKSPEWAKFTGLTDDEQNAKLDEIRAANADAFQPAIEAEMVRRAEARKAKVGLAGSVEITL
jgi:hypothetical protein